MDPVLGETQFVVSTIKDFRGERILYSVIKEKMMEKQHFIHESELIMIADFKLFFAVAFLVNLFLYICL